MSIIKLELAQTGGPQIESEIRIRIELELWGESLTDLKHLANCIHCEFDEKHMLRIL